jgi:hypothetical protein
LPLDFKILGWQLHLQCQRQTPLRAYIKLAPTSTYSGALAVLPYSCYPKNAVQHSVSAIAGEEVVERDRLLELRRGSHADRRDHDGYDHPR